MIDIATLAEEKTSLNRILISTQKKKLESLEDLADRPQLLLKIRLPASLNSQEETLRKKTKKLNNSKTRSIRKDKLIQ
jgi:hypothetical protein